MLLELIATCVIGAGVMYTPPVGWTLEQVAFVGRHDTCHAGGVPPFQVIPCAAVNVIPVTENRVTLRRTVQVDERVKAPPDCEMTLRGEGSKEETP